MRCRVRLLGEAKGEAKVDAILQRLMAIEGVTGVLLVGKDGLVVASTIGGEDEEILGAMAAAAYDASGRYVEQLSLGSVRHALFELGRGAVQITDAGEMLIVVRSVEPTALGRIRVEAERASRHLAERAGA